MGDELIFLYCSRAGSTRLIAERMAQCAAQIWPAKSAALREEGLKGHAGNLVLLSGIRAGSWYEAAKRSVREASADDRDRIVGLLSVSMTPTSPHAERFAKQVGLQTGVLCRDLGGIFDPALVSAAERLMLSAVSRKRMDKRDLGEEDSVARALGARSRAKYCLRVTA